MLSAPSPRPARPTTSCTLGSYSRLQAQDIDGGDGGESNPPSRKDPSCIYYKRMRPFDLALRTSTAEVPSGQWISLMPPLSTSRAAAPRHCVAHSPPTRARRG